jgi:hypothetical protein
MDNFEEIGRRIDAEMERLRRYVDEELAPETEKRTASFLRDVSGKLDQFAQKLEARMARRSPPSPSSSSSSQENPPASQNSQSWARFDRDGPSCGRFSNDSIERTIDLAMGFAGGAGVLRGDVCDWMRRAAACGECAAGDEHDAWACATTRSYK